MGGSRSLLRRLLRDRSGNVAIVFTFLTPVLLAVAGGAVDMARWIDGNTRTRTAIDAAVLAGARQLRVDPTNSDKALALALAVYTENVKKRLSLSTDTIAFKLTDDQQGVTATGSAYLKTTLLNIVGIDSMPLLNGAGSEFPVAKIGVGGFGGSNLEVAIMLDVTGSMCDDGNGPCTTGTKIDGLKAAAKDLINIVVSADQSKFTSRAALVPFSTRIRVELDSGDGSLMKKLTNLNPTWTGYVPTCAQDNGGTWSGTSETAGVSTWQCITPGAPVRVTRVIMPCVTDRFTDGWGTSQPIITDDAPGSGKWFLAHGGDRLPYNIDSTDAPNTSGVGTAADPSDNWNYTDAAYCDEAAESNIIVPLSSDKTMLAAHVDGLEATGATAGPLATEFSWYMLSPNWAGIWPAGSAPGSYSDVSTKQANGAPVLRKVAVLMTDGQFNTVRGWKDQNLTQTAKIAKDVCANMKAQGIEIYTVGFALDQLPQPDRNIAYDTLQTCGTDVKHFYDSLTVQQLQTAFREIALNLSSVYLSR